MRDINQTSFFNVDITSLDIDEVLFEIVHCIQLKLQKE